MAFPKPITFEPTEKIVQKFWSGVDKTAGFGPKGDCWKWIKATRRRGYGRFMVNKTTYVSSRLAYFFHYKEDPAPLLVCHRCDNPSCVNPDHLFKDTSKGNSEDMVNKGRAAYGLRNGKYTHPEKTPRGDQSGARKNPHLMARGSKNGNSKLTEELVMQIREMYATGGYSSRAIGRIVHLDKSTVLDIVMGRIWKHLPLVPSITISKLAQLPAGAHTRRCSPSS